jgi:hypothetical protein
MDDGIMGYRHIVTDIHRRLPVSAMNNHPILYIHIPADPDVMDIAAHHGIEPDTAVISYDYIPGNCGIFSHETPFPDIGPDAFYCLDKRHDLF